MLLLPSSTRGQICEYYLPYNQNFNQSYDLDNGWAVAGYDTTLVFRENCWTQYIYRATGRWPFIAFLPRYEYHNYALRLFAYRSSYDSSRVERNYMLTPTFRESPISVSFDYCNVIVSPEIDTDGMWVDLTTERTGILQLGYISDTSRPESSYHPIIDIQMDPSIDSTDIMHHFRLDLRSIYTTLPTIKQFAFKMLTDITDVKYTNIYIDNFHASREMDTINYRDTTCQGEAYSGYGFTVDSTETITPGLHTFTREVMENYGMACYRLYLWVETSVTTHIDTTIAHGDTLLFLDSLIVNTGDYVFPLTSSHGCDSTVVLHVGGQEVTLVSSSQHICPGEEVTLTVSGVHIFRWTSIPADPQLLSQQGQNTVAVHPMENVVYQVLGVDGVLLAEVSVEMESCEGLWFPNVFTPDAESNNRFVIQTSLPVEEFEMTIYTRTGLLVWHSDDINQMWDGTRKGEPMPQGAYVYHWRLKSNNRVRSGLGTLTLLR